MRRWLARFSELATYCEERAAFGDKRRTAENAWLEEHGPHIARPYKRDEWRFKLEADGIDHAGADSIFAALEQQQQAEARKLGLDWRPGYLRPNWVPYGSVIVMDELHKWFDQRKQREEAASVLDTLSMHRHGLYMIEVMSQTAMMANKAFRDMADDLIICQDLRKISPVWGIRWPFPTFRYSLISVVDMGTEIRNRHDVKPEQVWVEAPWIDGGLLWRLYDSFTHAGSARSLAKQMEATRREHEGKFYDPAKEKMMKDAKIKRRSSVGVVVKWLVVAAVLVGVFRLGRDRAWEAEKAAGAASQSAAETRSALETLKGEIGKMISAGKQGPAGVSDLQTGEAVGGEQRKNDDVRGKVTGIGAGFVVVAGQVVECGGQWEGWQLMSSDGIGGSMWRAPDGTSRTVGVGGYLVAEGSVAVADHGYGVRDRPAGISGRTGAADSLSGTGWGGQAGGNVFGGG